LLSVSLAHLRCYRSVWLIYVVIGQFGSSTFLSVSLAHLLCYRSVSLTHVFIGQFESSTLLAVSLAHLRCFRSAVCVLFSDTLLLVTYCPIAAYDMV